MNCVNQIIAKNQAKVNLKIQQRKLRLITNLSKEDGQIRIKDEHRSY